MHGGLRYLKQLNFHLVFEALRERKLILRDAVPAPGPPVEFIYPLETTAWDRAYVGAGVGVYDVLGAGRGVPSHLQAPVAARPPWRPSASGKTGAIKGGIKFYEGQLDDARHTMMLARTAADYGARGGLQHPGGRRSSATATGWSVRGRPGPGVRQRDPHPGEARRSTRPACGPTRSSR